ncbi:MAG: hypothetical protein V1706_05790 [Pseudomonadota bacterium]
MASLNYCSHVSEELEVLSEKLHKLSSEIDSIPSIDKYRVFPQIQGLNIIMTELDDRLCDMMTACHRVEEPYGEEMHAASFSKNEAFPGNSDQLFDYDFGG